MCPFPASLSFPRLTCDLLVFKRDDILPRRLRDTFFFLMSSRRVLVSGSTGEKVTQEYNGRGVSLGRRGLKAGFQASVALQRRRAGGGGGMFYSAGSGQESAAVKQEVQLSGGVPPLSEGLGLIWECRWCVWVREFCRGMRLSNLIGCWPLVCLPDSEAFLSL